MSITIILGDPHLGKGVSIGKAGIGSSLNSRVIDQINLLDWVLDKAIENMAGQIIISGDVFEDINPHSYLISLFISWLTKCKDHNIHVHIVMGNHDTLRSGNFYYSTLDIVSEANIDGVHIYKHLDTIFIDNFAYTMLPFRDRKSFFSESNADAMLSLKNNLSYELLGIPNTHKKVLVGHFAIEGSIHIGDEIDDMINELYCPVSMFYGYDYVWMGHVHKPQVMSKGSKKEPYVAHVGSMDSSNFLEAGQEKHIVIIDPNSNNIFRHEIIPTRQLKKIIINIPADTYDTTEYVIGELNKLSDLDKSIIKLEVSLSSQDLKPIDKKKISQLLSTKGVHNISAFSETKKSLLLRKEDGDSIDNSFDVQSAIKKFGELNIKENMRDKYMEIALEVFEDYKMAVK